MKAFALTQTVTAGNPVAHDLDLVNGQFYLLATDAEALAQSLHCDFVFFLGEWFLDHREGVPLYRDVFKKNPSIPLITSIFRRIVEDKEGVSHVPLFVVALDASTRALSISFEAVTVTGQIIDFTSPPLVLELP